MARLIRITIDVVDWRDGDLSLSMEVSQQLRTAKPRQLVALHCGDQILDENIDFTAQVVEDALRAAVSQTLGITQTLQL